MQQKRFAILAAMLIAILVFAGCGQPAAPAEAPAPAATEAPADEAEPGEATPAATEEEAAEEEPAAEMSEEEASRVGGWFDEVVAVEEPSAAAAVTRIESGELDMYAFAVTDPAVADTVAASDALDAAPSYGSYTELTFNPVGPVFESTGALNPFAVPRIREAMNYLVDRNFVAQEIYGGLAVPRFLAISATLPDYARLVETARALEREYAYNPELAEQIITEEMEALGAELVDGTWQYEGAPVELIFLIRTEDERTGLGDYVSNQLEDIGFVVNRDYRTGAEASPLWISGDPAAGLWHLYTGGWVSTFVNRDLSGNFDFFYTPRGLASPLWQAYTPTEEFDAISERLATSDFATLEERNELFAQALDLSMEDSARIFVVDRSAISPFAADISVAGDLAAGINASSLWAYTARREGEVGGTFNVAMPSILVEPWNPLGGTNWVYDRMLQRGTGEPGLVSDPYTGLSLPLRIERAEVTAREGLPITVNSDWVTLDFAPEIQVPEDAFVDWDAEAQQFITAGEKFTETATANIKSTVYYPADLYELQWHDGSNFSIADVMMFAILTFDPSKEASPIYDEATVPAFDSFLESFRGFRIVQEDPLVIEWYSNVYTLDAENNVTTLFPNYGFGTGAWHNMAVGILSEQNGELAFTADKADAQEIEWMSFIAGPSLPILENYLTQAASDGFIPYEPTLGQYISAEEAQARYGNLQNWYGNQGHFWIGTGPYYLEEAFPVEGTVVLRHNENYPNPASRWAGFGAPPIPVVDLTGPARVTIGEEAVFEVTIDFEGEPYATSDISEVKYLAFDATGELAFTGTAEAVGDGLYEVVLSAEQTGGLEAGANRLEVAVVSNLVSIPAFDNVEFVTVP
jgi:peptide/nickel transport system substrate-binding protein